MEQVEPQARVLAEMVRPPAEAAAGQETLGLREPEQLVVFGSLTHNNSNMSFEVTLTKYSWLWGVIVAILLGAATAAAVTQSQVDDLRADVSELEQARIESTKDIASIKTTQASQHDTLIRIEGLLREELQRDRNNRR